MSALHQQAVLAVTDPATFELVQDAVQESFSAPRVEPFLKSLKNANLRIRDFEDVLAAGKLGADTAVGYARLDASGQGQIRELYLASLEKVDISLRDKYLKLYSYY